MLKAEEVQHVKSCSVCEMSRQRQEMSSDICAQRRFRSVCAFAQTDLNLRWGKFWITKNAKFLRADNEDWSDCADAQADLSRCIAHTWEGMFFSRWVSYDVALLQYLQYNLHFFWFFSFVQITCHYWVCFWQRIETIIGRIHTTYLIRINLIRIKLVRIRLIRIKLRSHKD